MKDQIIHAIDIGTTKIAAIAAKRNQYGKIEILGIGNSPSFGVKRGVVINIDRTVHAIQKAVEECEKQSNTKFAEVYVGIAGQHIKSLQHRGILTRDHIEDEIGKADIDKLISDMFKLSLPPGDKIIHVLPQEYIVDNEQGIKEPVGMAGIRLEGNFHIVTGQVGHIHNINRSVKRAGLEEPVIVLEPLASAAAVLSPEEMEAGVSLVDIGGGTTDLTIFEDGIIRHTAVIPFGGDIITEDIKTGCMILREQAEKLKVKFGSALALDSMDNEIVAIPGLRGTSHREITIKNLAHIIMARMQEILEHVLYELKTHGFDKKLIGGLVITGGGSQLKNLVQLAQYVTGLDARIGFPNEHVTTSKIKEYANPMYATGVGLVIKGFEDIEDKKSKGDYVEKVKEIIHNPQEIINTKAVKEPKNDKVLEEVSDAKPSKPKSSFLPGFLKKAKDWFEEDFGDDYKDLK